MRTIDDSNRKIYPAVQVADELGITAKALVDFASKLNLTFLIQVPGNTEIYLKGITLSQRPTTFAEAALDFSPIDPDAPIKVSPEVKYLCLEASDCELVIEMGSFPKNEFRAVSPFEKGTGSVHLTPNAYAKRFLTKQYKAVYLSGSFFTFLKGDPTIEKSIVIRFDDILIGIEDLQAIKQDLRNTEPDYGKFEKGDWTSTMLAHLNEASTYFFSSPKPNATTNEMITEIETWLRERWGRESAGAILVNEAAKAIIPDEAEQKIKISDYILGIRNDYTSTTLTKINEAAFYYWNEMKSNNENYKQDKLLLTELKVKYKFKGRLIKTVSTIIRPNENKRIKITSPH